MRNSPPATAHAHEDVSPLKVAAFIRLLAMQQKVVRCTTLSKSVGQLRRIYACLRLPGACFARCTTVVSAGVSSTTWRTRTCRQRKTKRKSASPSGSADAIRAAASSFRRVLAPTSLAMSTSWSRRRSAAQDQLSPACFRTTWRAFRSASRLTPRSSSLKDDLQPGVSFGRPL